MLLRAEDKARFRAKIERSGPEIWASYSVDGQVDGKAVTQHDERMFASEQEARNWLIGEGELRGFGEIEPEVRPN